MKLFQRIARIGILAVGILWLITGLGWLEALAFILLVLLDLYLQWDT